MYRVGLADESLSASDVVAVLTDHSSMDYDFVASHARLVDTRGRSGAPAIGLSSRPAAPTAA